jgi:WD40 repeat protein
MTPRLPALAFLLVAHAGVLWSQPANSPEAVTTLKGHTDTVEAVAVGPGGALAATGSFDKTARLYDLATGQELRTFGGDYGHKGQVLCVAFSPKGDRLATGGADNTVRIWDVPAGTPARVLAALAADRPAKTLQHPNLVGCAAFDDTGARLATGCHDGVLRIWDVPKNAAVTTINAHVVTNPQQVQNPIYAVAWSPDHKQVFTGSYDKTIKLWDVTSGNLVREFKAAPAPKPIEPKKDETKKEEKKDDKKDERKTDDQTGPPGHRDQVFSIALTRDGKFLASASSDRTVKLWEVATGRVIRDFPNPDLKPVFPTEPAPSHPSWVQVVRFTPDDNFLVTAGPAPRAKGYLALWDVRDGKRVFGAELDTGPVHALAVTPDGKRLVLGHAAAKDRSNPEAVVVNLPER